jgi:ectoine hydroxylase-related dioxygenase (phytanoyl-CoA dioxygenase family)
MDPGRAMRTETVSSGDVEAFDRDGAVCIRRAFSADWMADVEAGIEANLRAPGGSVSFPDGSSRSFFQDANNWTRIAAFRRFAFDSPAKSIAAALLRARKINFLHDHVLVKEPGADKRTIWHQDQPYSPVDGWSFCTMWLSVDPVPRPLTLEFVAGSHRWGKWFRPQRFSDSALRADDDPRWEVLPDIDAHRDDYRIVGWEVEPGDAVVFHGLTLHGAAGNSSSGRRRVLSTRWTGDDARFRRRSGKMSPPPPLTGAPADGAILDCDAFPVVWRAADPAPAVTR